MCLAIPGKVVEIKGESAIVDYDGVKKQISIQLIKPKIGEYVLVHAGFAIEIMNKNQAEENLRIIRQIIEENKSDLK